MGGVARGRTARRRRWGTGSSRRDGGCRRISPKTGYLSGTVPMPVGTRGRGRCRPRHRGGWQGSPRRGDWNAAGTFRRAIAELSDCRTVAILAASAALVPILSSPEHRGTAPAGRRRSPPGSIASAAPWPTLRPRGPAVVLVGGFVGNLVSRTALSLTSSTSEDGDMRRGTAGQTVPGAPTILVVLRPRASGVDQAGTTRVAASAAFGLTMESTRLAG